MGALLLAGECVYLLPYGLRRDFQNPFMDALGISHSQMGTCSAVLGALAVASYVPGGWVADRVSARKLLVLSLALTGLGGPCLLTKPSFPMLVVLHGCWGVSSILLFWGGLLKATRAWGGQREQGTAFGLLEGGRGLISAVLASTGVAVFAVFDDLVSGFHAVVWLYTGGSYLAAAVVWLVLPEDEETLTTDRIDEGHDPPRVHRGQPQLSAVVRLPAVWLAAFIVFFAYTGWWATFDLAGFAVDGFEQSELVGARVSAMVQWTRVVAAVGAGLLADRFGRLRTLASSFVVLAISAGLFASLRAGPGLLAVLWLNAIVIATAVFALRGTYFALVQEGRVPLHLTGTAMGLISVVGFTPDVFAPLVQGWLLGAHPGALGHRYFFAVIAVAAALGLLLTRAFQRVTAASARASVAPGTAPRNA
jgi:MFS family permease